MHWAETIAEHLIHIHPGQQTFVCASGISPSGPVHIGNFREIVTTHFIAKALEKAGKNVRFLFSWDDFDRFRKVPATVDPAFERYIGMPYSEVPCPFGCHASYAEHFEKQFEESLDTFGIKPEFLYQSREYQSRRYNPSILHALSNRLDIYDRLASFKTGAANDEERAAYYPVHVYCESCRKDTTRVQTFDEQSECLTYSCRCGHQAAVFIPGATNIKLQWKLDWPMRWRMENVLVEPGGRDHSSETGSYRVSSLLSETLFGYPPPYYVPYEFISIKGSHAKMSSSTGNLYTPNDLLNVYPPELILYLFAKYQPGAAFHIGMDEDVIRTYSEYERDREDYASQSLAEDRKAALDLTIQTDSWANMPPFSLIASIAPLVNFDLPLLNECLARTGEAYADESVEQTARRADYWTLHWYPQKRMNVNQSADAAYYETLSATERAWVQSFVQLLREGHNDDGQLMSKLYALCHHEDKKTMRRHQKRLFQILYRLVLNSEEGPRIPLLVQVVGAEQLLKLMAFNK